MTLKDGHMTGPVDDSHKHKAKDAAKFLAESFFGLNMNPAEVGGEVLFDDYDDVAKSAQSEPDDSAELDAAVLVAGGPNAVRAEAASVPNRFEENLDDLIVFSDDDDDDTSVDEDEEEEEEDDENFDFGEEDEEEDDEEEEDDFDDDEEEDDDEEDDDVLDDEDLDFGSDVIDPAPKRAAPAARDSRPQRDQRGSEPRSKPAHVSGESRDHQKSSSSQREERPASRDTRAHGTGSTRSESSNRPHASKSADAGRKSASGDEDYWKELDGWVWDEETPKKPASASVPVSADLEDDDDDVDDDDLEEAAPAAASDKDEDAPARRRGRRRGGRGRGRGRGRRDEGEVSEPAGKSSESSTRGQDFDDDFSEILFEEDQEDFVSVSAGSVKAQRRVIDEPQAPAGRVEPDDLDDDDDDDDVVDGERGEKSEERPGGPRRGRRGRRGRGRGRGAAQEESRETTHKDVRPAASARRPVRDEDDMDDDDDDDLIDDDDADLIDDDDAELSDFGDLDDEIPPRRREGAARAERAPDVGRGRSPRPTRESAPPERSDRPSRERKPVAAESGRDERRGPRAAPVAPEFQGIPTWEEAIGSLAIRTPTEEHARRAENRGRRDGGGRPPRRRN